MNEDNDRLQSAGKGPFENQGEGMKKDKRFKILLGVLGFTIVLFIVCVLAIKLRSPKKALVNVVGDTIYNSFEYEDTTYKDETIFTPENLAGRDVFNIALIGCQDNNTDTMLIATLNTEKGEVTLTSLMRDIYVEIPGHYAAKLNAAYPFGGMDLFYETIENNFDLELDGYVLVDYEAFEYIIDRIGGVEITLTDAEARYLNTTNYISNPAYRNVVSGTQILNGNQTLGYCRIRKRATADQEHDDFGRTSRQRTVLMQIYEKMKSEDMVNLLLIMKDILANSTVKTDLTNDEFNFYLNEVVDIGSMLKLNTYRIPENGLYENARKKVGSYNQSVLVITDWDQTIERLHQVTGETDR
ncbi:MAG: hypothetical protein E7256_16345 [Lachnospiraceae bacterium]|nr:hypothetical protein [Lachnospiraceae bacterium]